MQTAAGITGHQQGTGGVGQQGGDGGVSHKHNARFAIVAAWIPQANGLVGRAGSEAAIVEQDEGGDFTPMLSDVHCSVFADHIPQVDQTVDRAKGDASFIHH